MKDFKQIYNNIYSKYKDRVEEINNAQKEITKQALLKVLGLIIMIAIIFTILILKTNNIELLVLLCPVLGLLFIYYGILKGKKISTTITPNIHILEEIYSTLISEGFEGLEYSGYKKGISAKTYNKGKYEKYQKFDSEAEIEGVLNNKNEIKLSYVATSWRDINRYDSHIHRGRIHYIFRGYFVEAKLNKSTKMQIKINKKIIKYLDNQDLNEKNNTIAQNIQIILKQFKESNKMDSDVTICDDTIFIRISTNIFNYNKSNDILNKDSLEKYYNGITEILNLTDKIIESI